MKEINDQRLFDENPEDDQPIDLRRYWHIFWRHKISIFGLAFIAGIWGNFVVSSMQPIYSATTTLMIEPEIAAEAVGVKDSYDPYGRGSYYATQYEILRSRIVAERLIDRMNLVDHPEFRPGAKPKTSSFDVDWRGWLKAWLPQTAAELIPDEEQKSLPQQELDEKTRARIREGLANRLRASLSVVPVPGSRLVTLSYTSTDPKLAAELANNVAEVYVEYDLEARMQMRSAASGWLTERVVVLRETLRKSEAELQEYREQEKLLGVGQGAALGPDLQSLSTDLTQVKQRLAELQASISQVRRSGDSIEGLMSIPAVLGDPTVASLKAKEGDAQREVATLSKRYGPKHPKMIKAQADLDEAREGVKQRVLAVVQGLEREYQVELANQQSVQSSLDGAQANLREVERKSYKLAMLEREVESNRQLYEMFLNRFKETKETGGLEKTQARVIDYALPNYSPIAPDKGKILLKWIGGGMFLGLLLAFVLEYLDNTFKGPGDIEEKLRLSMLGMLSYLDLKAKKGETPLSFARDNKTSFFAESIRTIRTAILLSGLDDPHKVIVVTSSVPGEGKSTIAMTLADALGEMEKVLLIDADMRRPTVAKNCGLERDASGLSDLVAKSAGISECVHRIGESNVYVMPSGMVPPNPLELISSHRFAEVLDSLGKIFNYIILDSAPSLAVSDSLVLSTYASGVVYVVKADSTPYPVAQEGVKRLRQANAHIIGAVLNSVPRGKKSSYYGKYGYYYRGKYYGNYYQTYGYTKD